MKAEISLDGKVVLRPETSTEAFAVNSLTDDIWKKKRKLVVISMPLDGKMGQEMHESQENDHEANRTD